jgi:hypothetical protein
MPSSDQKTIIRTIHALTIGTFVQPLLECRDWQSGGIWIALLTRDGFGPAWAGRLDIRLYATFNQSSSPRFRLSSWRGHLPELHLAEAPSYRTFALALFRLQPLQVACRRLPLTLLPTISRMIVRVS